MVPDLQVAESGDRPRVVGMVVAVELEGLGRRGGNREQGLPLPAEWNGDPVARERARFRPDAPSGAPSSAHCGAAPSR